MLQEYPKLWSLIGLATLIMFGLLFVFFGHRNDESVSLIKTIIKIAIALVISACLIWIASHFLEPRMAIIVGSLAGIFFFVTLWSALGWIRSIIMTLLTLISVIVGIALVVFIVRIFFPEIGALIAFIQTGNTQLMTILTLSGILVGAGLIASQLRSSLASALGQSTIATIVSVVILGFFLWVSALSTPITVTIFALLFGALLWIMRFRIVSDLFADSVRIFRVALLLGIIMAILVWFIL